MGLTVCFEFPDASRKQTHMTVLSSGGHAPRPGRFKDELYSITQESSELVLKSLYPARAPAHRRLPPTTHLSPRVQEYPAAYTRSAAGADPHARCSAPRPAQNWNGSGSGFAEVLGSMEEAWAVTGQNLTQQQLAAQRAEQAVLTLLTRLSAQHEGWRALSQEAAELPALVDEIAALRAATEVCIEKAEALSSRLVEARAARRRPLPLPPLPNRPCLSRRGAPAALAPVRGLRHRPACGVRLPCSQCEAAAVQGELVAMMDAVAKRAAAREERHQRQLSVRPVDRAVSLSRCAAVACGVGLSPFFLVFRAGGNHTVQVGAATQPAARGVGARSPPPRASPQKPQTLRTAAGRCALASAPPLTASSPAPPR